MTFTARIIEVEDKLCLVTKIKGDWSAYEIRAEQVAPILAACVEYLKRKGDKE